MAETSADAAAAIPTEAPRDETLLDVVLARFADFRAHRCSRLTLSAQMHASARPDELAEYVLRFLDAQSKRVDVKVRCIASTADEMSMSTRALVRDVANQNALTLYSFLAVTLFAGTGLPVGHARHRRTAWRAAGN